MRAPDSRCAPRLLGTSRECLETSRTQAARRPLTGSKAAVGARGASTQLGARALGVRPLQSSMTQNSGPAGSSRRRPAESSTTETGIGFSFRRMAGKRRCPISTTRPARARGGQRSLRQGDAEATGAGHVSARARPDRSYVARSLTRSAFTRKRCGAELRTVSADGPSDRPIRAWAWAQKV
jgi:hypothetical protein